MTIAFSNSSPKIRKSGFFGSKFKYFYFRTNICNKANLRVLISNMTMAFQNCCPKHPNKAFLVPNLRIFIFAINFAFWKIRGYFKYCNSFFFQISAWKYPNMAILVLNLRILISFYWGHMNYTKKYFINKIGKSPLRKGKNGNTL